MSTGLLFITASAERADFKAINRILLNLRDWENGDEGAWDRFYLVPARDGLHLDSSESSDNVKGTAPPVPAMDYHAWSGATIDEVGKFLIKQEEEAPTEAVNQSIYVLIDDEGLSDGTCVLGERVLAENDIDWTDKFNKVRLPQDQCYLIYCNLDIANMEFDDFCDHDEGPDVEGWWEFQSVYEDSGQSSEIARKKKRELLEEWEREGKV